MFLLFLQFYGSSLFLYIISNELFGLISHFSGNKAFPGKFFPYYNRAHCLKVMLHFPFV